MLVQKHRNSKRNTKRDQEIGKISLELNQVEIEMGKTEKEVSRLQTAIKEDFCKLNTSQKLLMDSVKILARNIFYLIMEPFKKLYDNYRDDHVIFRNLTRSHGCIRFKENIVDVILFPTAHYQPKMRSIVETILEQINSTQPPMPDNSGRIIRFSIEEKKKKLLAIGK